jgi:hypothetical protein
LLYYSWNMVPDRADVQMVTLKVWVSGAGFTDASPDYGGGTMMIYQF